MSLKCRLSLDDCEKKWLGFLYRVPKIFHRNLIAIFKAQIRPQNGIKFSYFEFHTDTLLNSIANSNNNAALTLHTLNLIGSLTLYHICYNNQCSPKITCSIPPLKYFLKPKKDKKSALEHLKFYLCVMFLDIPSWLPPNTFPSYLTTISGLQFQ